MSSTCTHAQLSSRPPALMLDTPRYLPPTHTSSPRSSTEAKQIFEEGNAAIFRRDFTAAIDYYSWSLNQHAVAGEGNGLSTEDLCSLFNLRSFAYFQLSRYAEAEQDGRMVIEIDPSNKTGYSRLYKSLEKQERFVEAYECAQKLLLSDSSCVETKSAIQVLGVLASDKMTQSKARIQQFCPIEVRLVSPSTGRGIFAVKDIFSGEKIFTEFPIAIALKDRFQGRTCACCGSWLPEDRSARIECSAKFCLNYYCNEDCKQLAEREFHEPVCGRNAPDIVRFFNELGETEEKTGFFPFELYAVQLCGLFIQMVRQGQRPDLAWLAVAGRFCGDNYSSICRRLGRPAPTDPSKFLACLPQGSWSSYMTVENFNLLAGVAFINCNPVAVRDETDGESYDACGGLFPMQSVLNHSCQPNVEVLGGETKAQVVIQALKNISAGEELCSCYVDMEYQPKTADASSDKASSSLSPALLIGETWDSAHIKHLRDVWSIPCNCRSTHSIKESD